MMLTSIFNFVICLFVCLLVLCAWIGGKRVSLFASVLVERREGVSGKSSFHIGGSSPMAVIVHEACESWH